MVVLQGVNCVPVEMAVFVLDDSERYIWRGRDTSSSNPRDSIRPEAYSST